MMEFVQQFLRQGFLITDRQNIAVFSIVKAELFYGAMRSNNPTSAWARQRRFLEAFVSLPLDDFAALIAGRVRAQLANAGTPVRFILRLI